jgi:hypothetical protein
LGYTHFKYRGSICCTIINRTHHQQSNSIEISDNKNLIYFILTLKKIKEANVVVNNAVTVLSSTELNNALQTVQKPATPKKWGKIRHVFVHFVILFGNR